MAVFDEIQLLFMDFVFRAERRRSAESLDLGL
jgi:hypothetical protein